MRKVAIPPNDSIYALCKFRVSATGSPRDLLKSVWFPIAPS